MSTEDSIQLSIKGIIGRFLLFFLANYHVRTVTYATAGKLKAIYEKEMVFENASWVADTGRFSEYVKDTSKLSENEYVGEIIVNRDAIVDVIEVSSVYEKTK